MTQQLQQANRIAQLRERRAQRVRREAKAAELKSAAAAQQAHDVYKLEREQRENAEFMLRSNPADPQALLWRRVSDQKCESASMQRADAYDALSEAREHLLAARTQHERAAERADLITEKAMAERKAEALRRETIADEAAEECRQ